jgi:hypothetical protein
MQAQAPPVPPPVRGFWLALLFSVDETAGKKAMLQAADDYAERFETKMDATIQALNLRRLSPRERLAKYIVKPFSMWLEQMQKYPKDFREDWSDFRRLRDRYIRGDFASGEAEQPQLARMAPPTRRTLPRYVQPDEAAA